jgi:hypothetical protein
MKYRAANTPSTTTPAATPVRRLYFNIFAMGSRDISIAELVVVIVPSIGGGAWPGGRRRKSLL